MAVRNLLASQEERDFFLPGLSVPLRCRIDFRFADKIIDLKSTKSMPANGVARPDNARQGAIYSKAWNLPVSMLYVTEKRISEIPIGASQCSEALASLYSDAKRLEAYLRTVKDAYHALSISPLNENDYFLTDDERAFYHATLGGNDDRDSRNQDSESLAAIS